MVPYPVMYNTYSCRKICRACVAVRIEEKKGLVHALQSSSVQRPVDYVVMLLSRGHVIDILSVILSAYGFPHTYELPCVYGSHKFDKSSIKMELFYLEDTPKKDIPVMSLTKRERLWNFAILYALIGL